jgi:hypothetical protein
MTWPACPWYSSKQETTTPTAAAARRQRKIKNKRKISRERERDYSKVIRVMRESERRRKEWPIDC